MEKRTYQLLLFLLIAFIPSSLLFAQSQSERERVTHQFAIDYIMQYKDFAIAEMERTGIPASITLVQGMHESNYGRSRLARLANNHFGAKCHNSWKGDFIKHSDDAPNERFRKYHSVLQSFQDHSKILAKKRYGFLFNLSRYDYKAWCHGLKKAGYATDPNYAYKLIAKIERYSLFIYDRMEYSQAYYQAPKPKVEYSFVLTTLVNNSFSGVIPASEKIAVDANIPTVVSYKYDVLPRYKVQKTNGAQFLRFSTAVYPVQIAAIYDLPLKEVLRLNNLESNEEIAAFTNIYLTDRKDKAEKMHKMHKVIIGQDLKEIAKRYAVSLEALRAYNHIAVGTEPIPGELIALRKNNDRPVKTYAPTNKAIEKWEPIPNKQIQTTKTLLVKSEEEFRPIPSPKTASAISTNTAKEETISSEATTIKTPINNPVEKRQPTYIKQNKPIFHYIQSGETLYSISKTYSISVEDLKSLNKISSNIIQVNTVLRVR